MILLIKKRNLMMTVILISILGKRKESENILLVPNLMNLITVRRGRKATNGIRNTRKEGDTEIVDPIHMKVTMHREKMMMTRRRKRRMLSKKKKRDMTRVKKVKRKKSPKNTGRKVSIERNLSEGEEAKIK